MLLPPLRGYCYHLHRHYYRRTPTGKRKPQQLRRTELTVSSLFFLPLPIHFLKGRLSFLTGMKRRTSDFPMLNRGHPNARPKHRISEARPKKGVPHTVHFGLKNSCRQVSASLGCFRLNALYKRTKQFCEESVLFAASVTGTPRNCQRTMSARQHLLPFGQCKVTISVFSAQAQKQSTRPHERVFHFTDSRR